MHKSRRHPSSLIASCLAAAVLTACGGDGGSVDGSTDAAVEGFSATLDGAPWNANAIIAISVLSTIAISGSDAAGVSIGIGFPSSGPGTFPIGGTTLTNGGVFTSNDTWTADSSQGSGTITVTSLDATRAVGSFFFTAPAQAAGTTPGSREVTQGFFDVEL